MSHYTLQSGQRTDTITSRCPVCHTVTYHTKQIELTDETVCCRPPKDCRDIHIKELWSLWHRAQLWGTMNCPGKDVYTILQEYMTYIGR